MDVFLFKDVCLLHTFIGRAEYTYVEGIDMLSEGIDRFCDVYRVDELEMGGYALMGGCILRDINGCMRSTSISVDRVACYEQLDSGSDLYSSYMRLLDERYDTD